MMSQQIIGSFAAAVYGPEIIDRSALSCFVDKRKSSNVRVGGILQETLFDSDGERAGIDAVDIATGRRIPIKRPTKNDDECGLDVYALTETTEIMRNAIGDRLDLMVVEKFGNQEQIGKGLIDEILQTIAEDIPLLIAVPEIALPIWQERSGNLGSVLSFNEDTFENWWQSVQLLTNSHQP